jgi:hypothetical protein
MGDNRPVALPGDLPLTLYRGDSYQYDVVVSDGATGGPMDLTGVVAASEIRKGSDVIALDCTVAGNVIHIALAADAWGAMGPGAGRHDVQLTFADGRVWTPVAGPVTILADVTA